MSDSPGLRRRLLRAMARWARRWADRVLAEESGPEVRRPAVPEGRRPPAAPSDVASVPRQPPTPASWTALPAAFGGDVEPAPAAPASGEQRFFPRTLRPGAVARSRGEEGSE